MQFLIVLKGQTWLTPKTATVIIDHVAYNKNFCANNERVLFILRKNGFHPGKSHGNVNLEVICGMNI